VSTHLDYDRQWFNTLILSSHEPPMAYFVCRSFSDLKWRRPSLQVLQVQGCQCKQFVGSWQNMAFVFS